LFCFSHSYFREITSYIRDRHREPIRPFADGEIERFLVAFNEIHEDWQVQQAEDAIRLYLYFPDYIPSVPSAKTHNKDKLWADAVDRMMVSIRLNTSRIARRPPAPTGGASFTIM
jgi:hypothetical protein